MELARRMRPKIEKLRARIRPWRQTERDEVTNALAKANGNKALAARLLGIGKQTFYRKLKNSGR